MTPSRPPTVDLQEDAAAAPAETHGVNCRQLHCAVCTAHLENPQQRFCSPRCRSRARALRRVRLRCARCGSRQWAQSGESRGA